MIEAVQSTLAQPESIEELVRALLHQAVQCHRLKQWREAQAFCESVLLLQPTNADANFNLGVLQVQANQPKESLGYFLTALETNPTAESYWISYIDALDRAGQHDDAETAFEHAKSIGLQGPQAEALGLQLSRHIA